MNHNSEYNNSEWKNLPSGSLKRFADNTPASRRERKLRTYTLGAVATVLLAAVAVGFSLMGDGASGPANTPGVRPAQPTVVSLACSEAQAMFGSYHDGTLEDSRKHLLAEHLDYCGTCQKAYSQQFGISASAAGNPIVAAIFAARVSR